MNDDSHDDASRHRRQRGDRLDRARSNHTGHPRFCIEMLDAAFLESNFGHRVIAGAADSNGIAEEWIELAVPTELYATAEGRNLLAVTVRLQAGDVHILAIDVYPPGSLRIPSKPSERPEVSRQLLRLSPPRSGLFVELVSDPTGRIDAALNFQGMQAFNRADVPRLIRSFASAMDLVEQTIRDTRMRHDERGE
jgi:hypothetical protein